MNRRQVPQSTWRCRLARFPKQACVLAPGAGILFGKPMTARADLDECRNAIDAYNSALSDVSLALHNYAGCVSDSHGHEECSLEFSTLQSAQSSFEDAVSSYQGDCQ